MAIADLIVDVSISASLNAPSLPGTDTPAYIGYHTHWLDRIRTYFDPADMLTDGFTVNDPLYLMAAAGAAQNPHINKFKIIRGTTSVAQVHHFKVNASPVPGSVVGLTLTDPSGVAHPITLTIVAQTAAQVATALAAIVVSGLTLVVDGVDNTQVNITVNASGAIWYPSAMNGGVYHDVTPSATPSADLAAAALVDSDFYGVSGAWLSAANITDIATWVESNKRLHAYTTADTDNLTLGQGIFNTFKNSAYNRTYGQYSGTPANYGATALMANRFVNDAGSDTWAYVNLSAVAADALTPNQISAATSLEGAPSNNGNVYASGVFGENVTLTGLAASGLYIDIQRGIDALTRDIQLRIFAAMQAASQAGKRIPRTRKGYSAMAGQVRASLQAFTTSGFLSDDVNQQFVVNVPDPSTATATDKKSRIMRGLNFVAYSAGGVQTVIIRGNISL